MGFWSIFINVDVFPDLQISSDNKNSFPLVCFSPQLCFLLTATYCAGKHTKQGSSPSLDTHTHTLTGNLGVFHQPSTVEGGEPGDNSGTGRMCRTHTRDVVRSWTKHVLCCPLVDKIFPESRPGIKSCLWFKESPPTRYEHRVKQTQNHKKLSYETYIYKLCTVLYMKRHPKD